MSLDKESRNAMVAYRQEKADVAIDDALFLTDAGRYNIAANRLYYAAFHAVSALLIHDGHTFGSHQGAVIMLHQHYVKTGVLAKEDGAFYSHLQTMREKSDYNCTYNATKEDTAPRIAQTKQFIEKVLSLIE